MIFSVEKIEYVIRRISQIRIKSQFRQPLSRIVAVQVSDTTMFNSSTKAGYPIIKTKIKKAKN